MLDVIKKIYILLIVFLMLCGTIVAQENDCFRFGLKAGVNHSQYLIAPENQRVNELLGLRARIGYYFGIATDLKISQRVKWQPELLVAMHGSKTINSIDGGYRTINELTISIPILLRFYLNDRFYLMGGPQLGYIFDRPNDIRVASVRNLSDFKLDTFDWGLTMGVGYFIKQKWEVSARYFRGLIERDNLVSSSVINLSLGYWL